MAQPPVRDPFRHAFVVCAAILAVLLNGFVLVLGGMGVTFVMLMIPGSSDLASIGIHFLALCLLVIGLVNFQCMAHVYGFNAFEGTRVYKVANVINGLLIVLSAFMVFGGAGPIESGLIFATAASTLIAIHVGRPKPIPAGHCQTCGYDLAGLEGGVCPECGAVR